MTIALVLSALLLAGIAAHHVARALEPAADPRPHRCDRCHCAYGNVAGLAQHVAAHHDEAYWRPWTRDLVRSLAEVNGRKVGEVMRAAEAATRHEDNTKRPERAMENL